MHPERDHCDICGRKTFYPYYTDEWGNVYCCRSCYEIHEKKERLNKALILAEAQDRLRREL